MLTDDDFDTTPIPVGRLTSVAASWDFEAGWVRAPLKEIVFNQRLTKQARLLWLWLASVKSSKKTPSWGECELMLSCGTKARRSCLSQLYLEGFIDFEPGGGVVLNNPYKAFLAEKNEFERAPQIITVPVDTDIVEPTPVEKDQDPAEKPKKTNTETIIQERAKLIMQTWNESKPDGYSSLRSVSKKQLECISKHCRNLGIAKNREPDLIKAVCNGLRNSKFWSNEVSASGKNFNSVFGYGSPQDTKMKNIENLYENGLAGGGPVKYENITFDSSQQELIDAYKFVKLNLDNAKARSMGSDIERYEKLLNNVKKELDATGVSVEDIK